MIFNLLHDPFFPVLTASGRRWVSFPELAETGPNAPLEFDWPRADFNTAAFEFAVGVALLAYQPELPSDWSKLWRAPPGRHEVAEALAPFAHAFALDGDGPRFLQERVEGEANPIEALLIDTPGVNGQKKNADLLTHRGRYGTLGLPAAAMALYTLQQFAPSGGAGNRTSLRGGGPLSTFVRPGGAPSLWRTILANLPRNDKFSHAPADLPKILPWLAPTLISDKGRVVSERDPDAHPLQALFGMPRRIALQFGGEGVCAMTSERGPLVAGFVQKPWGVNYGLWSHPLTPYRRQKEDAEPYSAKPKSARFGYRDWTPAVVGERSDRFANPAEIVATARRERREALRGEGGEATLLVAGWAMNNMEAVAYLSVEPPLHLAQSEDAQETLDAQARACAEAGETVAGILVQAVRAALFSPGAPPATDRALFEQTRAAFYDATEGAFHDALADQLAAPEAVSDKPARAWLANLRRAALAAFEAAAPLPLDEPERAQRIAAAARTLGLELSGYGKAGAALFAILGLALPEAASKKGKRNAR